MPVAGSRFGNLGAIQCLIVNIGSAAIRIQPATAGRPRADPQYRSRSRRPIASKRAPTRPSAGRWKGARCGHTFTDAIDADSRCKRCGADLRSCAQCESFDTGKRFECAQTIAARISPKDARNACELFSPRVTVERETHSQAQAPNSARKAFDDLFK